ncbi:MAG: lysylphosphatidylglycerol synthase transmembrane domain-containing protein [Chloroflexota bacterium]
MNRKWLQRALIFIVLAILLYFALRKAPLADIWLALQQLQLWQITAILTLNAFFYIVATLRWWVIVEAENKHVPFFPLLSVRVSVFGVSYFTLGPQVGGEPLQVFALQRKYGLTYTHATAAVLMDKLLEFLVDFLLLAIGLAAILQAGVLIENGAQFTVSLIALVFLIFWPPVHLILLYNKRYPITALIHSMPFISKNSKPVRFLRATERLAGTFCQRHPRRLIIALIFSILGGAGMLIDYALIATFLNIHLPFWKMIAGWMMGWVSLLMPLPGGLGALEASQVFTLGKFGFSAATALSLTLVIRGRDMLIGGIGLLLAGHGVAK